VERARATPEHERSSRVCSQSVMTKAGPKYFVEKDDITVEVVWNPLGGFARQ
jgi:hypothetical protein